MSLTKPTSIIDLAQQLVNRKFKRITSLAELMGTDTGVDFFENILEDDMTTSDVFATAIPIIYENVSVKKYDYTLLTHVIFWLADGEPYIYTPPATVGHTRHGMSYKKIQRDEYLTIASNITAYDVLALQQRCEHDLQFEKPEKSLQLSITRYNRNG